MVERMGRDLQLTPAQRDVVGDSLRESRFKVREQQLAYQKQRHQIFWQALGQVREMLTPEQQKIFDREFARPWMMRTGEHEHVDRKHGPADDCARPMHTPPPKYPPRPCNTRPF